MSPLLIWIFGGSRIEIITSWLKIYQLSISESWLHYSDSDLEVQFPGYSLFRLDRSERKGGGVCAFANSNFKYFQVKELSYITESGSHQLWLKVQVGNFRSLLVCMAYRPPNTPLSCFESESSDVLTSAMSLNIPLYIVGDLSFNLLNISDTGSKTLLDLCNTFNLTQLIESPTRITESSGSLIDVMLTSNKNLVSKASVLANSISDHDLIVASLNLKKSRLKPTYVSTKSFKNFSKNAFLANLSNAPWSIIDILKDVEHKLDTFNSLFHQILNQHAPVKINKQRARPNSFINDNIRSLTRDNCAAADKR